MAENLRGGGLGGEAVKLAQDVGFPVFDKFIRPTDPFNGGEEVGDVETFNDARAEAIEQRVVLEGAENAAFARV